MHQVAKLVYLCLQCFLNQRKASPDVVLMAQVSGGSGADQGTHRARLVLLIASPAFSPQLSHQFLSDQISTKSHLLLACAGTQMESNVQVYMQRLIAAFSTQYDYALTCSLAATAIWSGKRSVKTFSRSCRSPSPV